MTPHIENATLERYAHCQLRGAEALSAEAHLIACAPCRAALPSAASSARLERIWLDLRARVDLSTIGPIERAAIRVGIRPTTARILVATPSLRRPWLIAVAFTLGFAVIASHTIASGDLPFLVLAPMLPVAGVAVSFGSRGDAAWEIGLATPLGGFPLMLIRSGAVLTATTGMAGLAALLLPEFGLLSLAWLLPSFALVVLTLLVSATGAETTRVAAGVCTGWVVVVALAALLSQDLLAAFGGAGQLAMGFVAVVSVIVLFARRHSINLRGGRHDARAA
jgi:hypothetical protein